MWFVVLQMVLTAAALVAFVRFGRRAQIAIELAALTLLGFLAATFLAALVPVLQLGRGPVLVVPVRRRWRDRADLVAHDRSLGVTTLIVALGFLVGLIMLDVATGRAAPVQHGVRIFADRGRPLRGARQPGLRAAGRRRGAARGTAGVPHRWPARRVDRDRVACGARSSSTARRSSAATWAVCCRWFPRTRSPQRCCSAGACAWKLIALYGVATVALLALFARDRHDPAGDQAHAPRADGRVGRGLGRVPQRVDLDPPQALGEHLGVVRLDCGRSCCRWCWPGSRTSSTAPRAGCAACTSASRSCRPRCVGLLIVTVLGTALNDSGIAIAGVMLGVMTPVLVIVTMRGDRARPRWAISPTAETGPGRPTRTAARSERVLA